MTSIVLWTAVAAIATALLAAGAITRFLWNRVGRPLIIGGMRFLEDWHGTDGRPGVGARSGVMERLDRVEHELTINGGDTLKDAVTKLATAFAAFQTTTALQLGQLQTHLTAQDRRLPRDPEGTPDDSR